jgi:hypothetical protein
MSLLPETKVNQLTHQKRLIKWKSRFDFDAFVIPFSIGHIEQGITCAGHTKVVNYQ